MTEKIVTGCNDCPCCDMLDMSSGYACRLVDSQVYGYIKERKDYSGAITPKWCPLKADSLTLKFIEAPARKKNHITN